MGSGGLKKPWYSIKSTVSDGYEGRGEGSGRGMGGRGKGKGETGH